MGFRWSPMGVLELYSDPPIGLAAMDLPVTPLGLPWGGLPRVYRQFWTVSLIFVFNGVTVPPCEYQANPWTSGCSMGLPWGWYMEPPWNAHESLSNVPPLL